MRSANPALTKNTFKKYIGTEVTNSMTLDGTVHKTFILLILLVASAVYSWNLLLTGSEMVYTYTIAALILALVFSLITAFVHKIAPFTAPLYALAEGFLLGVISAAMEAAYPGIVFQAISLTVAVLLGLLMAYRAGFIKATENFKLGVFAATSGIFLVYLVDLILRIFGLNIPFIHETGLIGIGFSFFVVIVAALNLVLDFDFIEQGVKYEAPKYMEWYGAFGLMVTLVWLYVEILHLLAKLRADD